MSTNGELISLYSFAPGNEGANPYAALVQGSDGYFYGTTQTGGTNGYGTVFKISTNGALTKLYSFGSIQDTNGVPIDGSLPSGLVQGGDGYFYGTTEYGGAYTNRYGPGTVFRISTNGVLSSLYSFTGGNDGANPQAALVQGSDGFFYGTTGYGGNTNLNSGDGFGTVFRISANGTLASLHSFTGGSPFNGGSDGGNPGPLAPQQAWFDSGDRTKKLEMAVNTG
jgi:uncharacterized repeat protein (TIGR03803 family)